MTVLADQACALSSTKNNRQGRSYERMTCSHKPLNDRDVMIREALRLCQEPKQFGLLVLIIQWDDDGAQAYNSKVAGNKMRSVWKKYGGTVAATGPQMIKIPGKREDTVIKLRVRYDVLAFDNGGSTLDSSLPLP